MIKNYIVHDISIVQQASYSMAINILQYIAILHVIYMSQAWKRGWKIDDEVQSFHSNKGFRCGCRCICRQTMAV